MEEVMFDFLFRFLMFWFFWVEFIVIIVVCYYNVKYLVINVKWDIYVYEF